MIPELFELLRHHVYFVGTKDEIVKLHANTEKCKVKIPINIGAFVSCTIIVRLQDKVEYLYSRGTITGYIPEKRKYEIRLTNGKSALVWPSDIS